MAQSYKSSPDTDPANESDPQRPGLHYYSGGEIKELENTRVSPILWSLWGVVIVGAAIWLFIGGALGPKQAPFRPSGGSAASLAGVQTVLNKQEYDNGVAPSADMSRIIVPALQQYAPGETLDDAIKNGSNTYQNYCIGCHGPNQDGNGVGAATLNPKPRNLHDAPFMRQTMTYARINTSIHHGVHGTAMPRWENTLNEKEIQEVIAYVLSLTWDKSAPGDSTAPAAPAPPSGATDNSAGTGTVKSPTNSTTGTSGGSFVRGGSVSNSPAPITPEVEGNPAAATSTAPPSQSGQPAAVSPNSVKQNTGDGDNQAGGPKTPPSTPATGSAPGGAH